MAGYRCSVCGYIFDEEEEFSINDEHDYIYKFNLDEVEIIKIEVVSARDKYCGPNFKDIYKYLVKGSEIENMISDYKKYPEEYEKFKKFFSFCNKLPLRDIY